VQLCILAIEPNTGVRSFAVMKSRKVQHPTKEDKNAGVGFMYLEKMHKYELMLWLGIIGSSLIFTFLILSYLKTGGFEKPGSTFPNEFYLSTALLISGSFVIRYAIVYFRKDEFHNLKNTLAASLYLGVLFGLAQYFGWKHLNLNGIDFTGNPSGSYIYVLSGVHLAHLLGALIFLSMSYLHFDHLSKDSIKVLVASTDPYEQLKLKLMIRYWHFLDFSWLIIFLVLLFTW